MNRENKRQSNREKYPEIAKVVDQFRKAFGDQVKVIGLEVKDDSNRHEKGRSID